MTNSKFKFSMEIFVCEVKRRLLFSIFSLFILNSCVIPIKENFLNEDDVILEEEFIDNKIGWIEEINSIQQKLKHHAYNQLVGNAKRCKT